MMLDVKIDKTQKTYKKLFVAAPLELPQLQAGSDLNA